LGKYQIWHDKFSANNENASAGNFQLNPYFNGYFNDHRSHFSRNQNRNSDFNTKAKSIKNVETQTNIDSRQETLIKIINNLKNKMDTLEMNMRKFLKQENYKNQLSHTKQETELLENDTYTIESVAKFEEIRAEIVPSSEAEQWGTIKLMSKNIIEGILENGEILTLIIDSGSSQTLISEATVNESSVLSKLEIVSIPEISMFVGNDNVIKSNKTISIPLTIQQYHFQIPFLIVPNLTKRISIVGDDTLRKLNAVINLGNRTLQFEISPVCLRFTNDYKLRPDSDNVIKIVKGESTNCPFSYQLPFQTYDKCMKKKIFSHQGDMHIKNDTQHNFVIKKGHIFAKTVNNYVDVNFSSKNCNDSRDSFGYSTNNTIIDNANSYNSCNSSESYPKLNEKGMTLLDSRKDTEELISRYDNVSESHDHSVKDMSIQKKPASISSNLEIPNLTKEQKEFLSNLNDEQRKTYIERKDKYQWLKFDDTRLYKDINEIIDEKLHDINTNFNKTEQEKLKTLIKNYSKAFSVFGEIGEFKSKVTLSFKEHTPFAKRAYPIPAKYRDALEREVSRLKSLGILEDADNPIDISAGFPVLKSNKKDVRLIVDLRQLNDYTIKDSYKLLHFDILLKHMSDESPKVISIIDIDSAYFSLKVCDKSKQYIGVALG
jgi:hypothetical protein